MKVYKSQSTKFDKEVLESCKTMSTRKVAQMYCINESTIGIRRKKHLNQWDIGKLEVVRNHSQYIQERDYLVGLMI